MLLSSAVRKKATRLPSLNGIPAPHASCAFLRGAVFKDCPARSLYLYLGSWSGSEAGEALSFRERFPCGEPVRLWGVSTLGAAPVVRAVPVRGAGPVRRLHLGSWSGSEAVRPAFRSSWLLRFSPEACPIEEETTPSLGRLFRTFLFRSLSAPFSILSPIPLYPFRTGRALPRRPAACWGPSSSESGRSRSGRAGGTGRNRGGTGPEPGRNRA